MDWIDDGIVLHVRPHGEASVILELLTRDHGRHLGLVRGGTSKRLRGLLQPGNTLRAHWRARLQEHLGSYTVEPLVERVSVALANRKALGGLTAAAAVASAALPEREAHPRVYDGLTVLLDTLDDADTWPAVMARWELGLLEDLGFGLDLSACAVTGETENLAYVSPRSGRAVTQEAAGVYKERLLKLPAFLAGGDGYGADDIHDGLRLTGFFLEKRVFAPGDRALPVPRVAVLDVLGV
ncbi:DNA repair protein RecO [Pyruvatibacter sp.]|uniref:DNA repair protein RecO n=1 Tax=Pyruvatibacter sp. TaxID=1981328 RepID=UPI0032F020C2